MDNILETVLDSVTTLYEAGLIDENRMGYFKMLCRTEQERISLHDLRTSGKFDGKVHLDNSPVGKAVKCGFPLPKR